ncbi:MAG: PAS domain S-box protein [Balneolaceae bacterium]|nr:PAS domain S-box protein [Balneolaceae bacterium]
MELINRDTRILLNALQSAAAVVEESGDILAANEHWDSNHFLSSLFITETESGNFFTQCLTAVERGNDYALRLMIGIKNVLDGTKNTFSLLIDTHKPAQKWYKAEISGLQFDSKKCVLILFHDVSENMKTVQSLRESETRYKQFFRHSAIGIILEKQNGEIMDANPAACKMLGYSKIELLEAGRKLIIDENNPDYLEIVQTRKEKSIFTGRKEYIHKDGHSISVHLTSVLVAGTNGDNQLINTFIDLQQAEKSGFIPKEEKGFYETTLNGIPGIFFVINSKYLFVRWNDSLSAKMGCTDESMAERSVFDIFDETEHENLQLFLNKLPETGRGDFLGKLKTQQQGNRCFHLQFKTFESDHKIYFVATGTDITEFIEAEKEKEANRRLMAELFENSPNAIVMINSDNEVQKMNQSFVDLFGYSEKDLTGKNVNTLITCQEGRKEAEEISISAFNGKADQRKTIRLKKDGTKVPVLITTVPVRNNGEIIAVYGIYLDLTEQRKLEKHLKKSLHEKEILLQEVHHRVKNNLAIVASLLELQIIHDPNQKAKQQLQQAYTRIFSIAKIHETLYNHENIAEINFNEYLNTVIQAMPNLIKADKFNISLKSSTEPLILNINQAVPLGLLINELINLGTYGKVLNEQVELSYKNEDKTVSLVIKGIDKQIEEYNRSQNERSLHHLLIKTFVEQIDAQVKIVKNATNYLSIKFRKANDVNGSGNSLNVRTNGSTKSLQHS